jgi:hypothetical protein
MNEKREPILLRNEVEAALMEMILQEEGIPHYIKSNHDRVYDGIWQFQNGWGAIDAPAEYMNGIMALLTVIRNNKTLPRFARD